MIELVPLIRDLAIMLGVASIITILFQKIKQPVILGYIIAGVIVGPHTLSNSPIIDIPNIQILSELGIIFLMFTLGLDFSFHKLRQVGLTAGIASSFGIFCMLLLGYGIGVLLGWSFYNSIFLAAALATSSTTIIVKLLEDLGLKSKRFSDLIFGILVVEDLWAIILLAVLSTLLIAQNISSLTVIWATTHLGIIVIGWFLLGYILIPNLLRAITPFVNQETITVASVALCLFLVTVAAHFHYSTALGAFIMGSILAETSLIGNIRQFLRPVRDIFAAVFFISVGMMVNPKIIIEHWPLVLLLAASKIIGKTIISSTGTFLTGQSLKTSTYVGFSMAPIGEFSFIILALGIALNVTSDLVYQAVVAASAITILISPYLIKTAGYLNAAIDKHISSSTKFFLESYAAWIYRLQTNANQQTAYRKVIIKLFLNVVTIAVIFTLVDDFLLPPIISIVSQTGYAKTIAWLAAILLSSPFIWAVLFSLKTAALDASESKEQSEKNAGSMVTSRITPYLLTGWILIGIEITALSIVYFDSWSTTILLVIFALFFFDLSYKRLGRFYHWFERRLTEGLQAKSKKQTRYEELAPWDTHLVEVVIASYTPFTEKTLRECRLRQKFGINIVAIYRDHHVILAPQGYEKLLPYDKLIILGNDEQIDEFKKLAEKDVAEIADVDLLDAFALEVIPIEKGNPFIGYPLKSANLRKQTAGLVVGLERNGFRTLNPDHSITLQNGDLLYVVGKKEDLKKVLNTQKNNEQFLSDNYSL